MAEIRYKVRFWNWDGENECYSVNTEVFTDRDAAERCFNDHDATPALPFIQLIQEKIANGCVIDEVTIKERKRQEATVFEAITKDKPTLAGFLRSIPVIEAPWDDASITGIARVAGSRIATFARMKSSAAIRNGGFR